MTAPRSRRSTCRFLLLVTSTVALLPVVCTGPASATSPSLAVVCDSASVEYPRNRPLTISLRCTTSEGDPVDGFALVSGPTKAQSFSLDEETGHVEYRSLPSAVGTDTFTFYGYVTGLGRSPVTTASIELHNTRPGCAPIAPVTGPHDTRFEIDVECGDLDGDQVQLRLGTQGAAHGSVVVDEGVVAYTPAARFTGEDSFTLVVDDGANLSEEVAVEVTVTNARPTCSAETVEVSHDRTTSLHVDCADADGDALALAVSAPAQHGTVVRRAGGFAYKPERGYLGTDTFKVTAGDGLVTSAPARVTIEVGNARPTCASDMSYTTVGRLGFDLDCTDADGDDLRVMVKDRPRHGVLRLHGDHVSYVPDVGFTGRDDFALAAGDGLEVSRSRTVEVRVRSSRPEVLDGLLTDRNVVLDLALPVSAEDVAGRVTVRIPVGRHVVEATSRFHVADGAPDRVALDLTRAERRILSRLDGDRVPARVLFVHDDFAGRTDRHDERVVLDNVQQ